MLKEMEIIHILLPMFDYIDTYTRYKLLIPIELVYSNRASRGSVISTSFDTCLLVKVVNTQAVPP